MMITLGVLGLMVLAYLAGYKHGFQVRWTLTKGSLEGLLASQPSERVLRARRKQIAKEFTQ